MLFPLARKPVPTQARTLVDVDYRDPGIDRQIAAALKAHFQAESRGPQYAPYFLLVGANSSTGDALGPFVGWFLKRRGFPGLFKGDLQFPVHATNLEEQYTLAMHETLQTGKHPLFIAVDAAVGRAGRITVNEGPLKPGAGVGKQLPAVGSLHVLGGAAAMAFGIWFASLDQTVGMAEIIASAIETMWRDLQPEAHSMHLGPASRSLTGPAAMPVPHEPPVVKPPAFPV